MQWSPRHLVGKKNNHSPPSSTKRTCWTWRQRTVRNMQVDIDLVIYENPLKTTRRTSVATNQGIQRARKTNLEMMRKMAMDTYSWVAKS